jgi:hypothetical protein
MRYLIAILIGMLVYVVVQTLITFSLPTRLYECTTYGMYKDIKSLKERLEDLEDRHP